MGGLTNLVRLDLAANQLIRRYLPGQLVGSEIQPYQVGQAAQLRRYLPGQLVGSEIQPYQVGQAAQLRRYLPVNWLL